MDEREKEAWLERNTSELLSDLSAYSETCISEFIPASEVLDAFRWRIVKMALIVAGRIEPDGDAPLSSYVILSEGFSTYRALPVDDVLLAGGVGLAIQAGGDAIDKGDFGAVRSAAIDAAMRYAVNTESVAGGELESYASILGDAAEAVGANYERASV